MGMLFVFSTLAYLVQGARGSLPSGTFEGRCIARIIELRDRWLVPASVNVSGLNVIQYFRGYVAVEGGTDVLGVLLERGADVVYRYALVEARPNLEGSEYELNMPAYVLYTRREGEHIPVHYVITVYGGEIVQAHAYDALEDLAR